MRRGDEFRALFTIAGRIDAFHFALRYVEMYDRMARGREENAS